MRKHILTLGVALLALATISCKKKEDEVAAPSNNQLIAETYARIVYATYDDAVITAEALKTSIETFTDNPTAANLQACKDAYITARTPYEQSEGFRFYDGPIDNATDGPEGYLNAWPLDESYIDYVDGDANTGIINDITNYPTISTDVLITSNGDGGEEYVSCGYHAIEFLLWGQDLSTTGPGARPYTDYVIGTGGTASNQDRRAAYLIACADLLVEHLTQVRDAWAPGQNNYRATFLSNPTEAVTNIILGIGRLSKFELSGERMSVALDNHDQEDEHSCFSDQTTNDIILGQKSIVNIVRGKYVRMDNTVVEGTSLYSVMQGLDATFATSLNGALTLASDNAGLIQAPFDQEISISNPDGNARVQAAIDAIRDESTTFIDMAARLSIIISY
ncbi:MAG: imelysin family protein [Cytophagaceae bacterium]